MAFNRYRKRERYRRQYTFTKAKAVIGFILSAIFSISLSPYFDRYGPVIMRSTQDVFMASIDALAGVPQLKQKEARTHEEKRRSKDHES